MEAVTLRSARAEDHEEVSALALRSKGYWGYSADFLEACRSELTFSAQECGSGAMWIAERDGTMLGFASLTGQPPSGELDALFVDPVAIGTGCGALLLNRLLDEARAGGFTRLQLDADPQAEAFYLRFGARRTGTSASGSIAGRHLPRLEFLLH